MHEFRLDIVGPVGDCAILQVAGEIDAYTAPMLREQIRELAAKGAVHLIADLGQVSFLDSTGLGALVGGLKRLREAGGSLTLVITVPRIVRLFQITGLTKVLAIHPSVTEAITADPPLAAHRRNRSRQRPSLVPAARPPLRGRHPRVLPMAIHVASRRRGRCGWCDWTGYRDPVASPFRLRPVPGRRHETRLRVRSSALKSGFMPSGTRRRPVPGGDRGRSRVAASMPRRRGRLVFRFGILFRR